MFENEAEYTIPLSNSLRIAIVSYNIESKQLSENIQKKIINDNKKKINFIFANNVLDLYKYKESINAEEEDNGLLNKSWMNNVINIIPSVIIIHYQIKVGVNKEVEEKNIYQILEEIRNNSKTCSILLIIVSKDMHENYYRFNLDDNQKPNCLKNYIHKNNFYMFQNEDIWNFKDFANICNKIYSNSREFYRKYKKKYKEKRGKSKIFEERVNYDIKLGILSSLKSKKNNLNESKYFKEAYNILCNKKIDINNYIYTNKPGSKKLNIYEMKAVGDWLFFKLINRTIISEQINKYKKHLYCFSNVFSFDKGKKDYFHFIEYHWLYTRYKNMYNHIKEKISNKTNNKKFTFIFAMILLKQTYLLIKMIKFYEENFSEPDFDLSTVMLNGKKIDLNEIKEEQNIYFGKPICYFMMSHSNDENANGLNEIELKKDEISDINIIEEIYIKKFLINNKISLKSLIDLLKSYYFPYFLSLFSKLKNTDNKNNNTDNKNINTDNIKYITFYTNILKIIAFNNDGENDKKFIIPEIADSILDIYKIISNTPQIKKFTKIYIYFLKQYITLIKYKLEKEKTMEVKDNKSNYYNTELLINLSILGNLRKFEPDEETIFYDILNDKEFIPTKEDNNENKFIINLNYYNKENCGIINCNDLAIYFDYLIKNQEREFLDLVEYEFIFSSTLSKDKIKLNSLKLFFNYIDEKNNNNDIDNSETFIKEYNKEELNEYELGLNSNISIIYKLLLKHKKGKIILNKVIFTFCKLENIIYTINIPNELNKTILIKKTNKNVLDFKFPYNMINVGKNQLFRFQFEINKTSKKNIIITEYNMIIQGAEMNNIQKKLLNYKRTDTLNENDKILNYNIEDYFELNKNKSRKKIPGSVHFSKNNKNVDESSLIKVMFNNENERHMSFHKKESSFEPPVFFIVNKKSNIIEEFKNYYEITYDNFESILKNGKDKKDILIKLSGDELYKIKLIIKYFIKHEVTGDIFEFNHENHFYFRVISPMKLTSKIKSNNYLLFEKNKKKYLKEYLTDTNIEMNLNFNNSLKEDIIIKDIMVNLNDKDSFNKNNIEINTTIKDIVESKDIEEPIKEEILKIFKSSNYSIPFNIKFKKPFYGCIGKCKIIWTTESLKEFQNNKKNDNNLKLYNENEFDFPDLHINLLELKYTYEKIIKDNIVILNIQIQNKSDNTKILLIKIDNNTELFIISGMLKQKVHLRTKEIMKFSLKLNILLNGEVKLPDIIITELNKTEKDLLTNVYCLGKVLIK